MKTSFLNWIFAAMLLVGLAACKKHKQESFAGSGSKITPHDILSDDKYEELVVEIAYEGDQAPDADAISILRSFITAHVRKPKGIQFEYNPIPAQGHSYYTITDLDGIELKYRKNYPSRKKLTIFIFYANADYADNSGSVKILGATYGGSSFAVFGTTTRQFSGGLTQPERKILEGTVFNHEMAHLFGLVNNGSPMVAGHQDEVHGQHCTNEDCLMFYEAETSDIVANLVGANVPQLDEACVADIRANGGN